MLTKHELDREWIELMTPEDRDWYARMPQDDPRTQQPGKTTDEILDDLYNAKDDRLRHWTLDELLNALEVHQWMMIGEEGQTTSAQRWFRWHIHAIINELTYREERLKRWPDHPQGPRWYQGSRSRNADRVQRVKQAWPIDRFLQQILGCELIPRGRDKWVTKCPLPLHDDSTPSFSVDGVKQLGYCFGCNRGGDVIEIAKFALNESNFLTVLTKLEETL